MNITQARHSDCRAIAELAMMAGESIPAHFWKQSRHEEEDLYDVGARNGASKNEKEARQFVEMVIDYKAAMARLNNSPWLSTRKRAITLNQPVLNRVPIRNRSVPVPDTARKCRSLPLYCK